MKNSAFTVIEDFEKLVYKILLWVILIPKTILKVTIDPSFVRGYVRDELNGEKGKQFDEYISPVLLYLGIILVPAVILYFVPTFGVTIVSPQEDSTLPYYIIKDSDSEPISIDKHGITLRADVITKSDTYLDFHEFRWEVIQFCAMNTADGECIDSYYGELHDDGGGVAYLDGPDDNPSDSDWFDDGTRVLPFDGNSVSDTFYFEYPAGAYLVKVTSTNYYSDSPQSYIENYYDEIFLDVIHGSEE
ncbi:MAG: hypothetical protein HC797_09090, partial [Anaerolineales bacterium]|nr:hypothetical protein [Anaerolineales bacterium]